MPEFAHLHVHSHYSLLDGLAKVPDLVAEAKKRKMSALALTDHGVMYGAVEFYTVAKEQGLKPILGVEAYMAHGAHSSKSSTDDRIRFHLLLLAKNLTGYQNLIQLTTKAHLQGFYYKPRIDKALLQEHAAGVIGTSTCLNGEICKAIRNNHLDEAEELIKTYSAIFAPGDFYIELQRHINNAEQEKVNAVLKELARKYKLPLIATNDVHYARSEDAEAQDILVAIQTKTDLADKKRLSMRGDDFSLFSPQHMAELFSDTPEALSNTLEIVAKCNVELELGKTRLPYFELPENQNSQDHLAELCIKGLEKRYSISARIDPQTRTVVFNNETKADLEHLQKIKSRLEYELSVINKTGFIDYFLIVQDLVNWAKNQGIVVGPGRGSAAGSLVSYLLNITNLDPLKYELLFERFLNPERISMPDIDLDFTDARRDEVLAYARQKYGQDHVAQIITFGTMAARGAIRDVGRVLGYQYAFCDKLAKLVPFGMTLQKALNESNEFLNFYNADPEAKRLVDFARQLEGVARHASTHACGVVITKEPLSEHAPCQFGTTGDTNVVTQYEMHSVEKLGLLKMDFLGLKNLTIIENTLRIITKVHGQEIDIDQIPLHDLNTFKLLQRGDTTGIFQLESEGMRRYLKQLVPTEFEDIIAMVSLYRPGPMELIPTYINRKHGREPVNYLHARLEPIFKKTYGIMVYQEQLLQAAQAMAGFSLAEADILRKAVGKKIRKLLQEQKTKLLSGMARNKIPKSVAEEFWKLVEPFDRYGFNRSHAACYAMIAYQTAYLKAHYPTEFMASLLNARAGNIDEMAFLVDDARASEIAVLPPDINESLTHFTVTGPKTIRFGLAAIKNVGEKIVEALITERQTNGRFINIADLVERVRSKDFNKKSLESLVKTGAFDSLEERGKLIANTDHILRAAQELRQEVTNQSSLFGADSNIKNAFNLRLADATAAKASEKLGWEKELLGLFLSDNPLKEHADFLKKHTIAIGKILAAPEVRVLNRPLRIGGHIENIRRINTKKGDPMLFVKIRDASGDMEVVVFPKVLEKTAPVWTDGGVVVLQGTCQKRNGEYNFICEKVKKLE